MNRIIAAIVGAAVLPVLALAEGEEEITLKDLQGRTLTAKIQSVNQREAVLISGGKPTTVKLPLLDPASKEELIERAKKAGLYDGFPVLKVQVMVGTKRRPGDSWYEKRMEIVPRIVVEAGHSMDSIPAMKASMVIITMDTRAKYVQKKEIFTVQATETKEIPAAETGAKREVEFDSTFVDFDSYRDASNVGGAVYKYYIFGLRDAATDKVIYFDTNCAELAKHVGGATGDKAKYLDIGKGNQFKTDF